MRCPKCGYISFDHLSACSNCSRDLTAIAEELHGTSIETDLSLFLGSVIGEEPSASEMQLAEQDSFAETSDDIVFADAFQDEGEITLQLDESPAAQQPEDYLAELEPEPSPELTLDMDEIPPLDLSHIEEETGAIEEPQDQTDMFLSEAGGFQEGQEQLTLNLDEIDLSDLAPLPDDSTDAVAQEAQEEELTLDLGLDMEADAYQKAGSLEESTEMPILDLDDFMLGTGLEKTDEIDQLQSMLSNKGAGAEDLILEKLPDTGKKESQELKLQLESDDD